MSAFLHAKATEFDVDGIRLDTTPHLPYDFLKEVQELLASVPGIYCLAKILRALYEGSGTVALLIISKNLKEGRTPNCLSDS